MNLINNGLFVALLNEVIQALQVSDYEVTDNGVMIIHVTECDYEHYIETYDIKNDLNNHEILIDLLHVLKKRYL